MAAAVIVEVVVVVVVEQKICNDLCWCRTLIVEYFHLMPLNIYVFIIIFQIQIIQNIKYIHYIYIHAQMLFTFASFSLLHSRSLTLSFCVHYVCCLEWLAMLKQSKMKILCTQKYIYRHPHKCCSRSYEGSDDELYVYIYIYSVNKN